MKKMKIEIELWVPNTNNPLSSYEDDDGACLDVVEDMEGKKECDGIPCYRCVFNNRKIFEDYKKQEGI